MIELLVVITIIVVLLALLTPAMDKAIYQAQLAVCAANLQAAGNGAITYAFDQKRYYPYRPLARGGVWQPNYLYDGNPTRRNNQPDPLNPVDDRGVLRGYIELKMLVDPLSGKVDLSPAATNIDSLVCASPNLWFGTQYVQGGTTYAGMFRIGDRFSWRWNYGDGAGPTTSVFSTLVTDRHFRAIQTLEVQSTHPDPDGLMGKFEYQNQPYTSKFAGVPTSQNVVLTLWRTTSTPLHGPMDLNHGYADGSVHRLSGAAATNTNLFGFDERFVAAPMFLNGAFWADYQTYLPRE